MDRRKITHPEGKDKSRQSPEYGDSTHQSPSTFDERRRKYLPYHETPLVPPPVSESPYLQRGQAPEQEEVTSEHEAAKPRKKKYEYKNKATKEKEGERKRKQMTELWENEDFREKK